MFNIFFDSLSLLRGSAREVAALILCGCLYFNPMGFNRAVTHWVTSSGPYEAVEEMLKHDPPQSK